MKVRHLAAALVGLLALPAPLLADTGTRAGDTGISALWALANFCYAGMRAQNSSSLGWRITAFVLGFPGTLVSAIVVEEGGERVYGVDFPRADRRRYPKPLPPDMDV